MRQRKSKLGDIYFAKIDDTAKKYFQYVANDLSQLNSDVIRIFKRRYPINITPDPSEVVNDEVDIYVHCSVKLGLKLGYWSYAGHVSEIGKFDILFRDTNDYGRRPDEKPIKVSDKWHVWKINEEFSHIGKLVGNYKEAFIGIVINPNGILELLKGNKYPPNYPD